MTSARLVFALFALQQEYSLNNKPVSSQQLPYYLRTSTVLFIGTVAWDDFKFFMCAGATASLRSRNGTGSSLIPAGEADASDTMPAGSTTISGMMF